MGHPAHGLETVFPGFIRKLPGKMNKSYPRGLMFTPVWISCWSGCPLMSGWCSSPGWIPTCIWPPCGCDSSYWRFFMICEVFVVFYANIPSHKAHFAYLYAGLHGKAGPGAVDVVVSGHHGRRRPLFMSTIGEK
jgi:hypothetical protein